MAAPAAATSELRRLADLNVLAWPVFDGHDLDAMVTTRGGGVSAGPYASLNLSLHVGDRAADVLENRRRAAAASGLTCAIWSSATSRMVVTCGLSRPPTGDGARSAWTTR